MKTPERNRHSIFTFLSLLLICSGLIMDELSTRIALTWFPEKIFESNNFTIYLMARNLWMPMDIVIAFLLWVCSLALYLLASDIMSNKKIGWIVGGSIPLIYGEIRLLAGIHNIQLIILECLR